MVKQNFSVPSLVNAKGLILEVLPGLTLSTTVAIVAVLAGIFAARFFYAAPAMIIALLFGITLNFVAVRPVFQPGIIFCVKTLLRWAIALLGLRIAVNQILALGFSTAIMIILAMIATLVAGLLLARLFGQNDYYGVLAGAGTAVCGASATLATATVLPDYKGKEADIAFVVVAVNALSTLAMVLYPPLCALLGFDSQTTGVMIGATIHDVAQVAGAGYAVSETVGNTAVIVKLFRVFLLFPVVVGIGLVLLRRASAASIPIPMFAMAFLALCLVNSVVPSIPGLTVVYDPVKAVLVEVANWGLLVAISALGLGTSFTAIRKLGWRHMATVVGATLVILSVMTAGLLVF